MPTLFLVRQIIILDLLCFTQAGSVSLLLRLDVYTYPTVTFSQRAFGGDIHDPSEPASQQQIWLLINVWSHGLAN